jgi:hypothetical protein
MASQYRPPVDPDKAASFAPMGGAGMYKAKVVRVAANGIYITVPTINPGTTIGPCKYLAGGLTTVTGNSYSLSKSFITTNAGQALSNVTLNATPIGTEQPVKGNMVLCTFLDNRFEEAVVLGVLRP